MKRYIVIGIVVTVLFVIVYMFHQPRKQYEGTILFERHGLLQKGVYALRISRNNTRKITNICSLRSPGQSPDGSKILIETDNGLLLYDMSKASSKTLWQITKKDNVLYYEWLDNDKISFFIENNILAKDKVSNIKNNSLDSYKVITYLYSNQNSKIWTNNMGWIDQGMAFSVSPDGHKKLYFSPYNYTVKSYLVIGNRKIFFPKNIVPSWSNNSKMIAYAFKGNIYIYDLEKNITKKVTGYSEKKYDEKFGGGYRSPSWSPDDNMIICVNEGDSDIANAIDVVLGPKMVIFNLINGDIDWLTRGDWPSWRN